jgi:hypothetical protein
MTLMIEIGPEQEAFLLQEAARQGVDASEYVRRLIERAAASTNQEARIVATSTPPERARAFRQWAESHRTDGPLLSDQAISRESIYGERG